MYAALPKKFFIKKKNRKFKRKKKYTNINKNIKKNTSINKIINKPKTINKINITNKKAFKNRFERARFFKNKIAINVVNKDALKFKTIKINKTNKKFNIIKKKNDSTYISLFP